MSWLGKLLFNTGSKAPTVQTTPTLSSQTFLTSDVDVFPTQSVESFFDSAELSLFPLDAPGTCADSEKHCLPSVFVPPKVGDDISLLTYPVHVGFEFDRYHELWTAVYQHESRLG